MSDINTVPTLEEFHRRLSFNDYDCKLPWPSRSEPGYADLREAYSREAQRLSALFQEHLFAVHGVEDNPRRMRALHLAEQFANGSGLAEIAGYFDDLVELIK